MGNILTRFFHEPAGKTESINESTAAELKELEHKDDLASTIKLWKILDKHLDSLMNLEPSHGDTTTPTWILNANSESYNWDRKFLQKHLPSHEIIVTSPNLNMQ